MSYFASNIPHTNHCFFGRRGGVSQGLYDSLNVNLRSGDNHLNINRNLDLIAAYYGLSSQHIMLLNQGVSAHAEYIDCPSQNKLTADGVVTDCPDIILGIRTADCAPVLFYDAPHHIIGAAHAGWRGALRGIVENTLKIMLDHGAEPDSLAVAIGPCLLMPSFETGTDMYREFIDTNPRYADYFVEGADSSHYQFDLEQFLVDKLLFLGLSNITASSIDTYTNETEYFSYRRNTHQKLISSPKDFPTHLSTIKL